MENKPKLDIVDRAEKAIQSLGRNTYGNFYMNTTKIRKFLTAVIAIKNKVDVEAAGKGSEFTELSPMLALEVKILKTNILYLAGREEELCRKSGRRTEHKKNCVKEFIQKTEIIEIIDSVGNDYKKFQELCRYVEALVAFHKYYS